MSKKSDVLKYYDFISYSCVYDRNGFVGRIISINKLLKLKNLIIDRSEEKEFIEIYIKYRDDMISKMLSQLYLFGAPGKIQYYKFTSGRKIIKDTFKNLEPYYGRTAEEELFFLDTLRTFLDREINNSYKSEVHFLKENIVFAKMLIATNVLEDLLLNKGYSSADATIELIKEYFV